MIKQTVSYIFFLFPIFSWCQNASDNLTIYDTVQVYKCTYNIIRDGASTYYKIDGKSVTKDEFEKIQKGFEEEKKCNPCVLKRLNLDGSINSQGLFYFTCPGAKEEREVMTNTKEKATIFIQSNSCFDGTWQFYSEDGKVLETKYYDHGQELKTKSKFIN